MVTPAPGVMFGLLCQAPASAGALSWGRLVADDLDAERVAEVRLARRRVRHLAEDRERRARDVLRELRAAERIALDRAGSADRLVAVRLELPARAGHTDDHVDLEAPDVGARRV